MLRYKGRGLFLDPPTVGMTKGEWQVSLPLDLAFEGSATYRPGWTSQEDIFSRDRDSSPLAAHYASHIDKALQR